MKKNVLVFPCGSEIGLEIHTAVSNSIHFELFGGSSVDDHGKFVYTHYIDGIPNVDHPDFVDKINKIIDEYNIDLIMPAHDSVVLRLAQEKAKGSINSIVVTSPVETCEIARSKLKTYQYFANIAAVPELYSSATDVLDSELPVFLKPDVGQGSKGTQLATTLEDIAFYTKKDQTLLIMENLPGKEYTVDCFTDKSGKLLFSKGRERTRISNGISVNSHIVDDERFEKIANLINQKLTFRGVWFFQVKENKNDELVLMEIAPRIAGTMALVRCKGVNLALLSLFDALDYDTAVFENNNNLVIDRALQNSYQHDIQYQHAYIDLDDLVIFENKINPRVMAFVFQCINKKIALHLITRHTADLDETLKKYRLSGIFDEVIWVKEGEEKHSFINESDAIFIDDSFAERKKIHDNCHIPTFDSHMLESLIEKF